MEVVALAKPSNRMIILNAEDSKDFIKRFNQNVITPQHIKECEIAGKLFREKRSVKTAIE